ncbi:hypothetical protein AX15_004056 [Amanita polypyramis BW_CC]|nr:hypothetical protein AX15_004056 [Amanita polypyramis BW_CC]
MAGSDLFELLVTLTIFSAAICLIFYVSESVRSISQTTKEYMKGRGYDVSTSGVSIRMDKVDRETYLDATQRGIVRALEVSSVGQDGRPVLRRSISPNPIHTNRAEVAGTQHSHRDYGHYFHHSHGQHDEQNKKHRKHFWNVSHPEKEES